MTDLARYFLRLGALGFGGPIALAGYMQRDLVEERRWVSKQDYVEGLALSQLSPGPLAAQLAMYLGWARAGAVGATVIGVAFVLPSFLMVLALGHSYVRYGGLGWMQGAFYGIGAAVVAIIARSAVKLAKMTVGSDRLLWAVLAVNAVTTAVTQAEIVSLLIASGVVVMLIKAPPGAARASAVAVLPPFLVTGIHGPAVPAVLGQLAWYFTKAGAFVFGSGLAIVPFLYGGVVQEHRWLSDRQFLDAVAVAMITPGPVVITAGFIGYLTAGLLGSVVAAACTFFPPFLVVIGAARYMRKGSRNPTIRAAVSGVTAAAAGAIAGAAVVLGRRAIIDWPAAAICVLTLVLLLRFKKIPEPAIIVAAGLSGFALHGVLSR